MTTARDTDIMIATLADRLAPVRRLRPPATRLAAWLLLILAVGLLLATRAPLVTTLHRWLAAPDMWLSVLGSSLTAACAAIATFLVSLPDRSPRWSLLPALPLILWLAASGAGCLRARLPWLPTIDTVQAAGDCLPFILCLSAPLGLAMLLLLRPIRTLRPELTTLMAGLAVAASSASLLWLDHPFDAGLDDLLVHLLAVILVIVVMRVFGSALLRGQDHLADAGPRGGAK